MNGTHRIVDSIVFEVRAMHAPAPAFTRTGGGRARSHDLHACSQVSAGNPGTAVQVKDIERQPPPKSYIVTNEDTGNETQIFESAVVAEGLDVGPNVHSFAINTNPELAKSGIHQHTIGERDGCVYAVAQTGIRTRRQQAGFVFWIEKPTRHQLAQLSVEQDWSTRWGSFMLPELAKEAAAGSAIEAALQSLGDEEKVRLNDCFSLPTNVFVHGCGAATTIGGRAGTSAHGAKPGGPGWASSPLCLTVPRWV